MSLFIYKRMLTNSAFQNRAKQRQCLMALRATPLEEIDQIEPDDKYNRCIPRIQTNRTFRAEDQTGHKAYDNQNNCGIQGIKPDPAPSVIWLIFR